MAKITVDRTKRLDLIIRGAGGNQNLAGYDMATSELEVPDVRQDALNAALADYDALVEADKLQRAPSVLYKSAVGKLRSVGLTTEELDAIGLRTD